MGLYANQILPRCIDFSLSRPVVARARARTAAGLHGVVLEIGFGSGLNLPFLPEGVSRVLAVDPSGTARKLAATRVRDRGLPVEWCGLDGQRLALESACADSALCTFSMCTIPELPLALRELHRVLKPNGMLHFLEHGLSPEPDVAKWQHRLTPAQRFVAGNCHLNRAIADQLRAAGFCIDKLDNYYLPGPKFATYMYEGRARACDCG